MASCGHDDFHDPAQAYPHGRWSACHRGFPYDADLPLVLSEIDPVQNASVDAAVATSGFGDGSVERLAWKVRRSGVHSCYPPAVN